MVILCRPRTSVQGIRASVSFAREDKGDRNSVASRRVTGLARPLVKWWGKAVCLRCKVTYHVNHGNIHQRDCARRIAEGNREQAVRAGLFPLATKGVITAKALGVDYTLLNTESSGEDLVPVPWTNNKQDYELICLHYYAPFDEDVKAALRRIRGTPAGGRSCIATGDLVGVGSMHHSREYWDGKAHCLECSAIYWVNEYQKHYALDCIRRRADRSRDEMVGKGLMQCPYNVQACDALGVQTWTAKTDVRSVPDPTVPGGRANEVYDQLWIDWGDLHLLRRWVVGELGDAMASELKRLKGTPAREVVVALLLEGDSSND